MIFNWGANGSGTRPLRQGFVIVTLQTVRLYVYDILIGLGRKALRISIFGCGYVGLVPVAVFSEVRHQVTCMDIDPARIERIQGEVIPSTRI